MSMVGARMSTVAKLVALFYEHVTHVRIVRGAVSVAASALFDDAPAIIGAELIEVAANGLPVETGDSAPIILSGVETTPSPAASATTAAAAPPVVAALWVTWWAGRTWTDLQR